ncbi:Homeodomain-like domain-containing protein [Pseudoduganella lurida]|uniref:Homeodomain-like domain-containing protein n=1 Tax=Pseudoduganella lurida TaxID=1036180 RepID=A0A562RJ67_9BURK|nr:AAA family ATPase [Pseudoduganella lurida]TWI69122.1 Homeodomain-like domain-containing protein [Pseudoduganella lurida]
MENFPRKELVKVVQSGMTGSRSAFALAVGRFATKLKDLDLQLAQEIAQFLSTENVMRGAGDFVPAPVDADSRMELVETVFPVVVPKKPVFNEAVQGVLEDVLREWRSLDLLIQEGLAPARMLLFCGQPGVGKTLAAYWLAQELKLPLLTLNLATVMSSYLGKTGNNVRAVFDHAVSRPCVLLLDEFDAIAKRRDDDSDVGELKRLVNVLLQALDDWPANSLLIAATNHGELLDPAVWRRFDHVIQFEPPSADLIEDYLSDIPMDSEVRQNMAALLQGESFSTIGQLMHASRKIALLEKSDLVPTLVKGAVRLRMSKGAMSKPHEGEMLLMYLAGQSRREIAATLGKTHPTVSRVIKRYLGE